jgi:hypothetical protein
LKSTLRRFRIRSIGSLAKFEQRGTTAGQNRLQVEVYAAMKKVGDADGLTEGIVFGQPSHPPFRIAWMMNSGGSGSALNLSMVAWSCRRHIGICGLVEARVSVADLGEMEGAGRRLFGGLGDGLRTEHDAGERPEDAASRLGHALEKAAPLNASPW